TNAMIVCIRNVYATIRMNSNVVRTAKLRINAISIRIAGAAARERSHFTRCSYLSDFVVILVGHINSSVFSYCNAGEIIELCFISGTVSMSAGASCQGSHNSLRRDLLQFVVMRVGNVYIAVGVYSNAIRIVELCLGACTISITLCTAGQCRHRTLWCDFPDLVV